MIDLHTHILAGLDDGARTLDESIAIARAAVEDGIAIVAATPHVREDFPTRADGMEEALHELRVALSDAGVPLEVRAGGEIALDRLPHLTDDDLRRFGLGGNPAYLLLEFPYRDWPLGLESTVFALRRRGVTPVLAHPERNADAATKPERLRPLVEGGALVQLTAASLDGRLGKRPRKASLEFLELGLAHLLSSDAHSAGVRAIGLSASCAALRDPALAHWLTSQVPRAIIEDLPVPERPR